MTEEETPGFRVRRTQVWEFPPGEASDAEHAETLALLEAPEYDDWEVETL